MNIAYKLYTENKNIELVEDLVGRYFDGFTIRQGAGYYKGLKEGSLTIEVMGNEEDGVKVKRLAAKIRDANDQDCVLMTKEVLASVEFV